MGANEWAERQAVAILGRGGFGTNDVPGAAAIVRGALLKCAIRKIEPWRMTRAEGQSCRAGGGFCIFYRADLPPSRAAFVVLHELAHIHLGELRHCSREVEATCDAIAGALQCPREAFLRATEMRGRAWRQLALDFAAEPPAVAMRYHEVLDIPGVLVSPHSVRFRGPQSDALGGDEDAARRLARARKLHRGVRRERVPDRQLRLLLSAA